MKPTHCSSNVLLIVVVACVAVSVLPVAVGASSLTASQSADLEVTIDEQDGETVTVLVSTSASDVAGLDANLTFDPDVVQLVSAEGVDIDNIIENVDNDNGWARISQARASGVDAPTTTKITFEVVSEGTLVLDFIDEDTSLYNADHEPVPTTTSGVTTDLSAGDDADRDDSDGSNADQRGDGGGDRPDSGGEDEDLGYGTGDGESDGDSDGESGEDSDGAAGEDGSAGAADDDSGDGADGETDPEASGSEFLMHMGVVVVMAGVLLMVAIIAVDRN